MKLVETTWHIRTFDVEENRGVLRESLCTKRRDVAIGRARRVLRANGYFRDLVRYETTLIKVVRVRGSRPFIERLKK